MKAAAVRAIARFRREEDGGLIFLTLFFFVIMVVISGTAVDMMRFETARTVNQATLDRAVLAAGSRSQSLDPEDVVVDYFVKAGLEPPDRANIEVENDYIGEEDEFGNVVDGELVGRRVTARNRITVNNYFTDFWGFSDVDRFTTAAASEAQERVQNVEISLVVDNSGSMRGRKLQNLKDASAEFFETVIDVEQLNEMIDNDQTEGVVSISIIPYHHTVLVPESLLSRLDTTGETISIPEANRRPYPGALESYPTELRYTNPDRLDVPRCIRFGDGRNGTVDQFDTTAIFPIPEDPFLDPAATPLRRLGHFDIGNDNNGVDTPPMRARECNRVRDFPSTSPNSGRVPIMVLETDPEKLTDHINLLVADKRTAIENGVKWGAALLDPAMRPAIADMIEDGELPDIVSSRPNEYDQDETMKVMVVMTDGENTSQNGDGPSRIWYSERAWRDPVTDRGFFDPELDRRLTELDGYFVEIPGNPSDERWLRPGRLGSQRNDNRLYAADFSDFELFRLGDGNRSTPRSGPTGFPMIDYPPTNPNLGDPDFRQMEYIELYERFATRDLADMFRYEDNNQRNQHRNAHHTYRNANRADDALERICDAAKDQGIAIFSIAFEAPERGQTAMQNCATSIDNHYFEVNATGTSLEEAFLAIAGQISLLRLTQ